MQLPITYFGGKGSMINQLLSFFPTNYAVFVDAYGGSGRVLFEKPITPIEVYNDLEKNIYTLYKVLQNPESFKEFSKRAGTAIYHELLSKEYKESLLEDLPDVERAYRFWYVNRTRRGGGMGGMKISLIERNNTAKAISDMFSSVEGLPDFYRRLQNVTILNRDALDVIKQYDVDGAFIYCDPPYEQSTRTSARYLQDADRTHHENLVETLLSLKHAKVCLSGYDTDVYDPLVNNGWYKDSFTVKAVDSKNNRKEETEFIWMNYKNENSLISML